MKKITKQQPLSSHKETLRTKIFTSYGNSHPSNVSLQIHHIKNNGIIFQNSPLQYQNVLFSNVIRGIIVNKQNTSPHLPIMSQWKNKWSIASLFDLSIYKTKGKQYLKWNPRLMSCIPSYPTDILRYFYYYLFINLGTLLQILQHLLWPTKPIIKKLLPHSSILLKMYTTPFFNYKLKRFGFKLKDPPPTHVPILNTP